MKHLLKKKSFQGGGKKPKIPDPKPSILRPPNLGKYKTLQSYSVAEIIDLISDGPIEGLVNQNGELLQSNNILQGIYLDNTPVESTSSASFVELQNFLGSTNISNDLKLLGDLFYRNQTETNDAEFITRTYNASKSGMNIGSAGGIIEFSAQRLLFYDSEGNDTKKQIGKGYINTEQNWVDYKDRLDGSNKSTKFINVPAAVVKNPYLTNNGWNISNSRAIHNSGKISLFYSNLNGGIETLDILKNTIAEINNRLSNASVTSYEKTFLNESKKIYNSLVTKANNGVDDFGKSASKIYVCYKLGSPSAPVTINGAINQTIFKQNTTTGALTSTVDNFYFDISVFENIRNQVDYILTPIINANGTFSGKFYGCIIFELSLSHEQVKQGNGKSGYANQHIYVWKSFIDSNIIAFSNVNSALKFTRGDPAELLSTISKYNFNNISAEFRQGNEIQSPLAGFQNIYVDYEYNANLIGPFNLDISAQRLGPIGTTDVDNPPLIGQTQGSIDSRGGRNYSNWNDINSFNENAIPFTHTIENPNVESIFFTLAIENLSDTLDIDEGTKETDRKIGERRPAIVTIEVQVGITRDGQTTTTSIKKYSIIALVEGIMLIDFGCPELSGRGDKYLSIRDVTNGNNTSNLSIPFELPPINKNEDLSKTKRFIKIIKLSGESNSVLIKKEINVYKVTEIIKNQLSYPFSSLVGMKVDSRSFQNTPDRTFDCRLKKVLVPKNYFPLNSKTFNKDKRYIQKKSTYTYDQLIYEGDWNGSFKLAWTDNPAWIIYDLLTNKRYGLGRYIDESQINKWELYKIARFCDAVDENGYFIGVSDGVGGLEPRYSCNVMIKDPTKIYDSIVSIANLFRGSVYFNNSEINFLDDRPRTPIITFSNTNVKDGLFNYSNIRKDQQYNTIEVSYLDRFDNFQSKIEYVEDEQDIRKRGIFKSRIESFGVTSRAMARRIGQHMIYQTIKENQAVEFIAGLESLLCRPGDLIIVEDDLKTRAKNFGRILEIDTSKKSLYLENEYLPAEYNGVITIYTPTGNTTSEDLKDLAIASRSRVEYFDIKSDLINSSDSILIGRYYFDSYKEVFKEAREYFPLYTGKASAGHKIFCYYNTGVDGFVFSTGLAYQDNNVYDKVITETGVYGISKIIAQSSQSGDGFDFLRDLYRYNSSLANKRATPTSTSYNKLYTPNNFEYVGILESEINTVNYPQITNFYVTGYDNSLDYGSKVYLDQTKSNINLITTIKAGSPYRIGREDASDQIYKILAIREENQNEYSVVATKYDTGKFIEIEDFVSQDFLPATYYSGPSKVGNVNVQQLNPPVINYFTTGSADSNGFSLIANWNSVIGATKYKYNIYNEILNIYTEGETTETSIEIDNLKDLGDWKLDLRSTTTNVGKINSEVSKTGIFVAYYNNAVTPLPKAAILKFTIG
jgi:predicted phage tail protein